jgi:hypothetical protein
MTYSKAATFGKRGAAPRTPVAKPSRSARPDLNTALATTESGIPLDQIARNLIGSGEGAPLGVEIEKTCIVPWSWRAALLAGVCASCLQAGVVVISAQTPTAVVPGVQFEVGGAGSSMEPLLIAYSLWVGARSAAATMLLAHFGLRTLSPKTMSSIAYAIAGAGAAVAYALAMKGLGLEDERLPTVAAMGLMTGFMYRVLAGAKAT